MTHCLHSEDVPWSALGPGVEMRIVHADPKTGRASAFVHMHPGSRLISHRHIGASEFVVLEGNGGHPQADAINILGWIGPFLGAIGWVIALIWITPTRRAWWW